MTFFRVIDEIRVNNTVRHRHRNPNDCIRLKSIQKDMTWRSMLWFGHSYVSDHSIH
jgi:hypothetical protein